MGGSCRKKSTGQEDNLREIGESAVDRGKKRRGDRGSWASNRERGGDGDPGPAVSIIRLGGNAEKEGGEGEERKKKRRRGGECDKRSRGGKEEKKGQGGRPFGNYSLKRKIT